MVEKTGDLLRLRQRRQSHLLSLLIYPLILAAPSIAIDVSLKLLVWEDGQGKVWASYNSPDYLKERHNLPLDLLQNIAVVETLAGKAGQ